MNGSSDCHDEGGPHPFAGLLLSLTVTVTVAAVLGVVTRALASVLNALLVQVVVAVLVGGAVLYVGVHRDGHTAPTRVE